MTAEMPRHTGYRHTSATLMYHGHFLTVRNATNAHIIQASSLLTFTFYRALTITAIISAHHLRPSDVDTIMPQLMH